MSDPLTVAGVLVLAVVAISMLGWRELAGRRKRRKADWADPQSSAGTQELIDLTAQMEALAGRIDQRVSEAVARLDEAMASAQAKAEILEELARRQPAQAKVDEPKPSPDADTNCQNPLPQENNNERQSQEDSSPAEPAEVASPAIVAPTPAPPPPAKTGPAAGGPEILRLHNEGLSAIDIARQMKMSVGEVELVLNILKPRTAGKRQ